MNEYFQHTRESFLRDLLISGHHRSSISAERLNFYEIPASAQIVVASLSLIRFSYVTYEAERAWQLKKFGANNIIEEILADYKNDEFDIYSIDYSDSTIVLILISRGEKLDLLKQAQIICNRLTEEILLYLNISSNVGIGNVKNSIFKLVESYVESQKALELGEFQELNAVYTFEDIQDENRIFMYPFERLKNVSRYVETKEYNQIIHEWTELEHDLLQEYKPPLRMVQHVCSNFLSLLLVSDRLITHQMSSLSSQLFQIDTREGVIKWTRNLIEVWVNELKEEYQYKYGNQLVNEVIQYIENNYDQKIMLSKIAQKLYVNRNYLSQLFKRVTGETFSQYLNKVRIDKAKELISYNHYFIYEVSEMVGYQNATYFSQVFKSITGMSPSEFHKEVKQSKALEAK